jgi:hypothetical protein
MDPIYITVSGRTQSIRGWKLLSQPPDHAGSGEHNPRPRLSVGGVTWSPPLLLESGNRSNEDDTTTEQAGDRGLSRKRQSLSKKPRREDGEEEGGGQKRDNGWPVTTAWSLLLPLGAVISFSNKKLNLTSSFVS